MTVTDPYVKELDVLVERLRDGTLARNADVESTVRLTELAVQSLVDAAYARGVDHGIRLAAGSAIAEIDPEAELALAWREQTGSTDPQGPPENWRPRWRPQEGDEL